MNYLCAFRTALSGNAMAFIYALVILLCTQYALALETALPEGASRIIVKMEYRRDDSRTMTIDEIRRPLFGDEQHNWTPVAEDYANFGYRPMPYWYRFTIYNPREHDISQVLDISYPLLDSVHIYVFKDGELQNEYLMGDRQPYANRLIDHPHFLIPVNLQASESLTYYVRVMTQGSQLFPVDLWESTALFVRLGKEDQLYGIYFGVVCVIIFFNLLIFIALREKMYLYYALSAFVFMLFFAIMRAKLYPLVFSSTPEVHHFLLLILPASCLLFSVLFSREILKPEKYSPGLKWVFSALTGLAWLSLAGIFVLDSQTSLKISVLIVIPGCFTLFLIGPVFALKGNRMAWVYSFAWGVLMLGATVTAASKQGFIPVTFLTEYGMQIGSALELFILNAALAFRFHTEHQGRIQAQMAQLKEQEEKQQTERQLMIKSMLDGVTQLPNRTCLESSLQHQIETGLINRIAVCVLEINRFNEINRTLGHQNMELLMVEVASQFNKIISRIPGLIGVDSIAGAYNMCSLEQGGFCFLVDADQAEQRREQVRIVVKKLIQPIVFKEMRLELKPVIGVAIYPEHGVNTASLLRHAQVAADMPEALQHAISIYRPEHDQYNTRRLMMISELKTAIEQNHLELFFQPKLDLVSNEITGVEALVRWHHARYGLVRPDEFIVLAEETGVIKALTRWVIKSAFKSLKRFKRAGYDFSMSINISALNLRESDMIVFLKEQIYQEMVDPADICLELTETSMMTHPLEAIDVLERVCKIGLMVSIDDFGAGYSSLAYLKSLPASEIKIDKSLIAGICEDINSDMVARATIDMCHGLGFKVVAEGVEQEVVLNRLREVGCDIIQGYIMTPPLPYEQLLTWLETEGYHQRRLAN
jgi:EAL domain-containing protein (putative c-di-GMP-specific phosphodiesterase class I)/GGDEF domain-containing protein